MKLTDLIKIKYSKLTSSEQKIADYILSNSEIFLNSNAQMIGDSTGTSAASVVRFCKKIGFSGLEQLKVEIARNNLSSMDNQKIDPIIQKEDTSELLVKKIFSNVETSLKRTISLINYEQFEEVINIIKKAQKVFLYGIGASSLSAYDLYHKFNRIDKPTFYGFDGHMNIEFSVHSKPQDVAIIISYGGNSREVLLAARQLKENKTPIVAIVKEGETILSKIADYCIYVPDVEKQVKMGAVSSKFSQSFIIDIIYFGVIKDDLDQIFNQLEKTSNITKPLKERNK